MTFVRLVLPAVATVMLALTAACDAEPPADPVPAAGPAPTAIPGPPDPVPPEPEAVPAVVAPPPTLSPAPTPTPPAPPETPAPSGATATKPPTQVVEPPVVEPAAPPVPPFDQMAFVEDLWREHPDRNSATEREARAAEFMADIFRKMGYEPEIVPFEYTDPTAELVVDGKSVEARPMRGSPLGEVIAPVIWGGVGRPEDFPRATEGKVALIQRGELLFTEKINNAHAAGAVGVIIYNNRPGIVGGTAQGSLLPTVSVSRQQGQAIFGQLVKGRRLVAEYNRSHSGPFHSQNVVVRIPGREPDEGTLVIGAHHDTNAAMRALSPNDNGSGLAVLAGVADQLRSTQPRYSVDLVSFGSLMSEICYCGSEHYVDGLSEEHNVVGMLNLDALAVGDTLELVGSPELREAVTEIANRVLPEGTVLKQSGRHIYGSSDDLIFRWAEIPAMWLHQYHEPSQDERTPTLENINFGLIEAATKVTTAMAVEWEAESQP